MGENAEALRRGFDAIRRGDLDAFLELVDPEVEFTSLIAEAESRTFRGHEGVRQWWSEVRAAVGGLDYEVEQMRELGDDAVVVKVRLIGTVAGVRVEQPMWQAVLTGPGPRAIWWHFSRTEDEAMDALAGRQRRNE